MPVKFTEHRYHTKLEYTPKNPEKYDAIILETWRYITPLKYTYLNRNDIYILFDKGIVPILIEKECLPDFRKYCEFKNINLTYDRIKLPKDTLVVDILRGIGAGGKHLRIRYNSSRILHKSYFRPVLAYALSFSGCIIVFKKKSGYSSYIITNNNDDIDATELKPLVALKKIDEIKRKNLAGQIYVKDGLHLEITSCELINNLK